MSMQLEPEAEKWTGTGREERTPALHGNVFNFLFCVGFFLFFFLFGVTILP